MSISDKEKQTIKPNNHTSPPFTNKAYYYHYYHYYYYYYYYRILSHKPP